MQPVKKALIGFFPFPLSVVLLGFSCYWWVLDNGFISDDLVQLDQSGHLTHFRAQLSSAPNSFRLTAFAWFAGLQKAFGSQPVIFYVFSILLHCINVLLFRKLLIRRGTEPKLAALAAVLFLVMQNPNEAIGWLSAVNELLVGFFVLAVLLAAFSSRYGLCLAFYLGALMSKESGAVVVLLLPLFAWMPESRNQRLKLPRWLWIALGGVTIAFLARFLSLAETNFLIQSRFYSLKPNSVLVLAFSLHKLAFPWLYMALILALVAIKRPLQSSLQSSGDLKGGQLPSRTMPHSQMEPTLGRFNELTVTATWIVAALLPYIFLIYDTHLPSRHMYLAAMPAAYLVAQLVGFLPRPWIRWSFIIMFAAGNAGYLWLAKDRQYWQRGATTRELISTLRSRPPGCVVISDFPENPWIAKLSARFVPGWSPEMIKIDEASEAAGCLVLRWDAAEKRYLVLDREERPMTENQKLSRRGFIVQTTAGAGLYASGSLESQAQTVAQEPDRARRLPREVWVASIDLKDLYPETSIDRRIRRTLERMENLVPFRPDIVCLPETFNTSWVSEQKPLAEVAEEVPGPIVNRLSQYAKANHCYVICPIPTRSAGKIYNSAVIIDRRGQVAGTYHKIHATEGEMDDGVSAGPIEPPVFQTDFGKIGVQICYDANWFPAWQSLKASGAEIVFFPSQFPGGRILTTHAWMNQFYIVSSTGEDARIIDISGDDLAASGPFRRWVAAPVNLEKALVHIWPEVQKFPEIEKKYGRRVRIKIWHPENWATIESVDPELKIHDILAEFALPTYQQHISKADAAQKAKRT